MKDEGKTSKAPLSEAFGQWKNAKIVLLALFGLVAGQAVVWYTGQFYALFFLPRMLKVDGYTAQPADRLRRWSSAPPFFVVFGWLSDRIGRKPIILAGCLLAALTYFPLFKALTEAANPGACRGAGEEQGRVTADPADCSFQFNPIGTVKFTTLLRHRQALPGAELGQLRQRSTRRPARRRPSRSATRRSRRRRRPSQPEVDADSAAKLAAFTKA